MTEKTAEAMTETVILDAPAPLTFSDGETAAEERRSERTARLLEAGKYPDKKLHADGGQS